MAGATALALLWPSCERSYRGPAFGLWAFTRCWSPLWRSESVTGSASVGACLSVSVIGLEREAGGSNARAGPRWRRARRQRRTAPTAYPPRKSVDDSPRRKTKCQLVRRFCFLCSPGAALSSLSAALQCPSYPLSARRLIVCLLPLSWEFFANGRFLFVLWGALPQLSFVPLFRSSLPSVARLRKLLKRYLTTPIQH